MRSRSREVGCTTAPTCSLDQMCSRLTFAFSSLTIIAEAATLWLSPAVRNRFTTLSPASWSKTAIRLRSKRLAMDSA